jgi:hypothetical protein
MSCFGCSHAHHQASFSQAKCHNKFFPLNFVSRREHVSMLWFLLSVELSNPLKTQHSQIMN